MLIDSIVTNIDLDHQKWLGNDVDSIGKESREYLERKKPVVLGLICLISF